MDNKSIIRKYGIKEEQNFLQHPDNTRPYIKFTLEAEQNKALSSVSQEAEN
jgi:hypothetical protein